MSPRKATTTAPGRKRTNADRLAEKVRERARSAARRPCPTCGADTLHGPDDDRAAMTVTVDAAPVSVVDELSAYVQGRPSYVVTYVGNQAQLYRREPNAIRATPLPNRPVVLAHDCAEHPPRPPDPWLF